MVMTQEGVTALNYASQEGHVTVVRLMLEKGADVNICNKVFMDFVPCTYVDIQSVGCMLHIYVVYREPSVGSLHKHSSEIEIETISAKFKSNTNMCRTVACNTSPVHQCKDMMGLCIMLYVFFVVQNITNTTRLSHATKTHCVCCFLHVLP